MIPALIILFGSILLPGTPNYLIERGNVTEFKKKLIKILGVDNVDTEVQDLIAASETSKKVPHPWKSLFKKQYRPLLTFSIAIPMFQKLSGINVIMSYALVLFKTIGFGNDASIMSDVITGGVNVVAILWSQSMELINGEGDIFSFKVESKCPCFR